MATGQPSIRKLKPHQIRQGNQYNQLTIKLRIYVINPSSSLDPFVFICWYDVPHQIKFIANDTFDLIKDQIRSSRHSSKDPCIPFLPYMIHVAAKLSLRDKLTKLLPCQVTVAHRIHSSQPFVILGISHLSQTSHQIALVQEHSKKPIVLR